MFMNIGVHEQMNMNIHVHFDDVIASDDVIKAVPMSVVGRRGHGSPRSMVLDS